MNSDDEVINRIRSFIFDHFPLALKHSIGYDDALLTSGIVDPLGIAEVVEYLENEFDISLQDEDIESGGRIPTSSPFLLAFVLGASVMLLIGALACTAPTLRALKIQPTEALREGG